MKRKQKKNIRQRARTTHGWGSKKKHRGAGNRGGRGMAGTGKRGDAKKPSINPSTYFGKHGFVSVWRKKNKVINVGMLDILIGRLKGKVKEEKGAFQINLTELGYSKLLATGNVAAKCAVTVKEASESAIEKVKKAGGSVKTSKSSETKQTAEVKPAKEVKEAKTE